MGPEVSENPDTEVFRTLWSFRQGLPPEKSGLSVLVCPRPSLTGISISDSQQARISNAVDILYGCG